MKTKYEIELADNGMVVYRKDIGTLMCFEYADAEDGKKDTDPIARWIGDDILDDMLNNPDVKENIETLVNNPGGFINNYEISVEIRPVIKNNR